MPAQYAIVHHLPEELVIGQSAGTFDVAIHVHEDRPFGPALDGVVAVFDARTAGVSLAAERALAFLNDTPQPAPVKAPPRFMPVYRTSPKHGGVLALDGSLQTVLKTQRIDVWAKRWRGATDDFEWRRFTDCRVAWANGDLIGIDDGWRPVCWCWIDRPEEAPADKVTLADAGTFGRDREGY